MRLQSDGEIPVGVPEMMPSYVQLNLQYVDVYVAVTHYLLFSFVAVWVDTNLSERTWLSSDLARAPGTRYGKTKLR